MPYTGANAAFYEPSKVEMKMAAMYYGVQVGRWSRASFVMRLQTAPV